MASPLGPIPLPENTRNLLPNPQSPWRLSDQTFGKLRIIPNQKYRSVVLSPEDPEFRFVQAHFMHNKPPGYSIGKVEIVFQARLQEGFQSYMHSAEIQAEEFPPEWKDQKPVDPQRSAVYERWKELKMLFSPFAVQYNTQLFSPFTVQYNTRNVKPDTYQNIALLPLWHGTTKSIAQKICEGRICIFW